MTRTPLAVLAAVLTLTAGCKLIYTPPVPRISGPDTGYVDVPVTFTVSYGGRVSDEVSTWWHWGDSTGGEQSYVSTAQHAYTDTGMFVVTAHALCIHHSFPDQITFYRSDYSTPCTLRIRDGAALRPAAGR
jgi:hypothetical protein